MVAGDFARRNAGADLRRLDARLLFPIAYSAILEFEIVTEEVMKAREAIARKFNDAQFEYDTGLPAISRSMPSADQFVKGV
jgi:predicted nucleic acid-binding protein